MENPTQYPNPHTGHGFPNPSVPIDPIIRSNRLSLPFPREAAEILGNERGIHCKYDDAAIAAAQKQIYLTASIMGIWNHRHDEPPTAA